MIILNRKSELRTNAEVIYFTRKKIYVLFRWFTTISVISNWHKKKSYSGRVTWLDWYELNKSVKIYKIEVFYWEILKVNVHTPNVMWLVNLWILIGLKLSSLQIKERRSSRTLFFWSSVFSKYTNQQNFKISNKI